LDIPRKKTQSTLLRRYWPWTIGLAIVCVALNYLWLLSQADFSVDAKSIVTDEVKRGEFSVSVRGSGVLVPDNVQWLSASVEARVERVVVKPGTLVKRGDLIVELSNPQLLQLLEETQWELEARVAEATASQVRQKSEFLMQKAVMLNAKLDYESSKLKLEAHTQLLSRNLGVVAKIDYEQTRLETMQSKQRWDIQQEVLSTMQESIEAQNNARIARLNKMRKELERAQQQVENLKIVASIDSVVQEVPVEPGQRISMGGNIAKLAQQDSLIAEINIPELEIRNVAIGQTVIIDTRNNKVTGRVSRIDPAVVNGNVQVDVEFIGKLPLDARPDLAVEGEIKIAEISDTLFVNRPLFAQSQSETAVYKISLDGNFAQRVMVTLGKGSIHQIQVMHGLSLGDKIIISDPSNWDSYQKIRIN
jgi:HlyD family secretion protein